MEKQELVFLLNETDALTMILHIGLDKIDCCYEESILLIHNKKEIPLVHQAIHDSMYALNTTLKEALKKQLFLHKSISHDIGYLYNEYSNCIGIQDSIVKDTFAREILEGTSMWVGMRYYLWASKDLVSWLYNDAEGNIIFEITPFYPYMYFDAKKESHYIPYKSWIKNYKPYFIRKISKETAQQWLEKVHHIIEQIDSNIARWRMQEYEN